MEFQSRFDSVHRAEILRRAARFIWKPGGAVGLEYLRVSRALSEDTIRNFSVGYIPPEVDHQLAGRIIIPLFDPSYHLVVLGSRRIQEDPVDRLPVYWHEKYEKSSFLFGVPMAIRAMRDTNYCVIVEGQFDAMQLSDKGIKNVVATCGSKLSLWQISILLRYCSYLLILFDKDDNLTGQHSAKKILKELGVAETNCKITYGGSLSFPGFVVDHIDLPESGDPDEFVRKYGVDVLMSLISDKVDMLKERHDVYLG